MMKSDQGKRWGIIAFAAALVLAAAAFAFAGDGGSVNSPLTAPPGGDFQKVSDLVPLPEFIPGLGILYVDPATLPIGPFLGYDREGNLVHVTYMVPVSEFEQLNHLMNLATVAGGFTVDHVDVMYNPGHPGVEVPHYHITLWTISHEEAERLQ